MTEKQIQIPERLFVMLYQYFVGGKADNFEPIVKELNAKLDRVIDRELYTKSKVAPTEEERNKARNEYLDRRGIPKDFRY